MNNYQWLLQMDGADRKAWFDAEHVETEERALDGDTDAQNESYLLRMPPDEVLGKLRQLDELKTYVDKLTAERDELKGQVFTLKCECDDLESTCNDLENELYNATAERELYREALSQLLDTVTDGMSKVSAILDNYDEGMA